MVYTDRGDGAEAVPKHGLSDELVRGALVPASFGPAMYSHGRLVEIRSFGGGQVPRPPRANGSDALVVEAVNAIARGSGEYAEGEQMSERFCDGRGGVHRVSVEVDDRAC